MRGVLGWRCRAAVSSWAGVRESSGCLRTSSTPTKKSRKRWRSSRRSSRGDAGGTVANGGAPGGIEEAVERQGSSAGVLQAMRPAAGQVEAGARGDGSRILAGPEAPLSFENADHLFVLVEVVGCAAGRNEPDELRDFGRAGALVHQHAKPSAIPGSFGDLVLEADDPGGGARGISRPD